MKDSAVNMPHLEGGGREGGTGRRTPGGGRKGVQNNCNPALHVPPSHMLCFSAMLSVPLPAPPLSPSPPLPVTNPANNLP